MTISSSPMAMASLFCRKRAFTLLEIMIALIILTLGVVAAVGLFSSGMSSGIDAENTTIAMNLAQRKMERIRNTDFDTEIISEAKAVVDGFPLFQREVMVTEPETGLKEITVNVYWSYKEDEVIVPLVTYISKN